MIVAAVTAVVLISGAFVTKEIVDRHNERENNTKNLPPPLLSNDLDLTKSSLAIKGSMLPGVSLKNGNSTVYLN